MIHLVNRQQPLKSLVLTRSHRQLSKFLLRLPQLFRRLISQAQRVLLQRLLTHLLRFWVKALEKEVCLHVRKNFVLLPLKR